MHERSGIRINEEFKPAPQFKRLYYIYLLLITLFGVLTWYIPVLFFPPPAVKVIITIPVIAVLAFAAGWIPKYYESITYRLAEDEILWRRGVWFKHAGVVPYNRITNIDVCQGPISRILGIGTLKIQTAGYSGTVRAEIRIEGIENLEELKNVIMELVKRKKPVAIETYEEEPKPRGEDINVKILSELKRIRRLLEKTLEK
ncbi:MAG: membrane protein [Candidatus Bathyarchaeota archaeon B63]|nr:MAG: membrane protein [Candidatus Bathyarchaeota archaeon B63]